MSDFPSFCRVNGQLAPRLGETRLAKIDKFNWFTRLGILGGKNWSLCVLGLSSLEHEIVKMYFEIQLNYWKTKDWF